MSQNSLNSGNTWQDSGSAVGQRLSPLHMLHAVRWEHLNISKMTQK